MALVHRFTLVWTTAPSSFAPRHMRAVESVRRWHPTAAISVLSNTLPLDFFAPLSILVERYDWDELTRGTPAEVWYAHRHAWNRSSFFSNHEADLLRLLYLHRRGGAYVDTDVVFVRPLRLRAGCNLGVGVEHGNGV